MSAPVLRNGEGFSDSVSIDFADPDGGVSGMVRVEARAAASRAVAHGVVPAPNCTAAPPPSIVSESPGDWGSVELGGVRLADDGRRARAEFEGDGAAFEIEITRLGGAAFEPGSAFSDAAGVTEEVFVGRARGGWRAGGAGGKLRCLARVARTTGAVAWDRIELLRSLTAALDDGSLLAVAAARPGAAAGHGDEAVSAFLVDSEGSVNRFEEALVSTEYDGAGGHRRAGVELWSADDASPLRGAGTLIGRSGETAFLRFTLDGTPGTARYDIVRRPTPEA